MTRRATTAREQRRPADPLGNPSTRTPFPHKKSASPLICTFASHRLLLLIDAFCEEIEGVRKGEDIEHLHRMRVASRRMRACLNTFSPCFSGRRFRKVYRGTRSITRALGQARDADVQIAFLKKLRKRARAITGSHEAGGPPDPVPPVLDAIQFLLQKLRKERAGHQKEVVAALDSYEKEKIPDLVRAAAHRNLPLPGQGTRKRHAPGTLHFLAAEQIGQCYLALRSFTPSVHDPDAVAEHHAMRIAAKHLRYTMEIFAPLFRLGLRKYLARIARLQQILGDLHDTDVWIDSVTLLIVKERSRPRSPDDPTRPGPAVITGLKAFQRDREKERRRIYRSMVHSWDRLEKSGFWDALKHEVCSNYRAKFAAEPLSPPKEKRDAVSRLARLYPEGEGHSRIVAGLSLEMFDQLQGIHHLAEKERSMLEFASLLHDIGWSRGKKGHAKESASMIHESEDLPFSLDERGTIGFLARVHRGACRVEDSGYFALLPAEMQRDLLILAGIIRVADGLDGMHRGSVQSVRCSMAPDSVTCTLVSSMDCSQEIGMAREKADLLERVLGRPIVLVHEGTPRGASLPAGPEGPR